MSDSITDFLFDMKGRVVLVTGGTKGLGRQIAEAFLKAGADVTVCARTEPQTLPSHDGRTAYFRQCDVRNAAACSELIDVVAKPNGRLDVLVNNAGGSPAVEAATVSPRFSESIIGLNLLAPLYLSQAAYRWMSQQDGVGSIVNIASISGVRPSPGTAAYGAAKAGLLSLTRSLAQEWGPVVRVNAIIVGLITTENAELTYGSAETQQEIAESVPLKRMGRGADIAAATLFLSSPAATFISGAALEVHGGGEKPHFLDIIARHSATASAE